MAKVLASIKVVELGTFITGPCAAMVLADLGAEVIKIEQPGSGDPMRGYEGALYGPQFRAFNARKKSLCLNLKSPNAKPIFEKLISEADVLIENYRPGTLASLGYSWDVLHRLNKKLVYCAISGFGPDGPYAQRPCYDSVAQALSGFMSVNVDPETPKVVGPPIADTVTGIFAACGILGALVERQQTNAGRRVDVSMLDSLVAFNTGSFATYFISGKSPTPITRASNSQSYALRCADGKLIALHLASIEKFFRALVEAIEAPELGEDPRFQKPRLRAANYGALTDALRAKFATKTRDQWVEILLKHDIPHAAVNNIEDVLSDPQIMHNDIFQKMAHDTEGPVMNVRRPILYDGSRDAGSLPPPALAEHSTEILASLGLSQDEIQHLMSEGTVQ